MQNTESPLVSQESAEIKNKNFDNLQSNYTMLRNLGNRDGLMIYKLTPKDLIFYENKEMWIASFFYCICMDRIYTQKYLVINSKSLRLSCTIMNIFIPYFFLYHCKIIYRNFYQNNKK